ncbi:MAG: AzlD domain-containing protein [Oscillibacter sp.]|nr:AzlD domain-containing protein [Oscillibacter sp.]
MRHNIWLYIAVMAVVCYAIRVLPLTLLRRRIQNRFLRSFLYYVPYVTLSVMTFPSIIEATRSPVAGGAALGLGVLLAWMGAGLFPVAVSCCAIVFALEWFLAAA